MTKNRTAEPSAREGAAQNRIRYALREVEDAQNKLYDATAALSSIIGIPRTSDPFKLAQNVKALWYRLEKQLQRRRQLDREPQAEYEAKYLPVPAGNVWVVAVSLLDGSGEDEIAAHPNTRAAAEAFAHGVLHQCHNMRRCIVRGYIGNALVAEYPVNHKGVAIRVRPDAAAKPSAPPAVATVTACGVRCPEEPVAACRRAAGHSGRHEGGGLDWWDDAAPTAPPPTVESTDLAVHRAMAATPPVEGRDFVRMPGEESL